MAAIEKDNSGRLILKVYVQPKSSRDQIVGLHGDEIKVCITAPPIDGKANQHIKQYLAKQFGVAKSSIEILKGTLSRHKTVAISDSKKIPAEVEALMKNLYSNQ